MSRQFTRFRVERGTNRSFGLLDARISVDLVAIAWKSLALQLQIRLVLLL